MRRSMVATLVAGVLALASLGPATAVAAAAVAFPGNGWVNPVAGAPYEDWGFGICGGRYVAGYAHLGADSQGTGAGQAVRALGAGTVVQIHDNSWPGDAVGVLTTAGDGSRFLAVYGHIDRQVGANAAIAAGQQIGTITNQGANSHLHLGVRPLGAGEPASAATMMGRSACNGSFGYVSPIPWLAAHAPGNYPVGAFDLASGAPGLVRVAGWSFDRDNPVYSLGMHVYVGGQAGQAGAEGHAFSAAGSRPDVAAAYPGVGAAHGLDVTFATDKRGAQPVCLYAINIGGGDNVLLGCKTVNITDPNPFGSFDAADSPTGGTVRVRGWALDPNAITTSTAIHVYIGGTAGSAGAEGHAFTAAASRPDVAAAYPGAGDKHGLNTTITTSKRGTQKVCMYALNAGPGQNVSLGCLNVTIANPPVSCPQGQVGTPPDCRVQTPAATPTPTPTPEGSPQPGAGSTVPSTPATTPQQAATVRALVRTVRVNKSVRLSVTGVTGKLTATWTRNGRKVATRSATVKAGVLTLRAPRRTGRYTVTIRSGARIIGTVKLRVR